MRLFILIAFAIIALPSSSWAKDTIAKQAIIIDFETGQKLLSKNADQHMPTSSMSKVMTMYMIFDAIKDGIITMDTKFKVSEKAWGKGGSKMFVELGKEIKVKDLAQGVIVQSGNDATIVLAEGLAGSEEKFAQIMTERAMEIGMENSNFVNASGWPDPKHYSTAEDLTIMTRAMIEDFPEHYKLFGQKEFTYNNIKQQNRNPLLYRDIGADGLKTGHTDIAGYGLIGTAVKDDRRVVMVVNGLKSEKARADESTHLIEWALNNFINIDLIKSGTAINTAPVKMGEVDSVAFTIKNDIKITTPRMEKKNIAVEVNYKSPLIAPISAGQEIGTLTITIPSMAPVTHSIFAMNDVKEIGFFGKTIEKFKQFILGML
jgi:D-alanyl-D-alanine carboxypeptidase (penicillin-binding protein 5/6)